MSAMLGPCLNAPMDDINVPFEYGQQYSRSPLAAIQHGSREADIVSNYQQCMPSVGYPSQGSMSDDAASEISSSAMGAGRFCDLQGQGYGHVKPQYDPFDYANMKRAAHDLCDSASGSWAPTHPRHESESIGQKSLADLKSRVQIDLSHLPEPLSDLTTPPPSATPSMHNDAQRTSGKSSKKESTAKLSAAKPQKQCAYECCPSPLHSNKWRVVTPDTTAGGRDWTSLMGKTLCDSCYSTFRKHGTFIRSVRTPEGWTRFDHTTGGPHAVAVSPAAEARKQQLAAAKRPRPPAPEMEGLPAKRAARSQAERASSPAEDGLLAGRPSRSRKPSMRMQASINSVWSVSSPRMRGRRADAGALPELVALQNAHADSLATPVDDDALAAAQPDDLQLAPYRDEVHDMVLPVYVPLASIGAGCEVGEDEDLLSSEDAFEGSLDDFLVDDTDHGSLNDGGSTQDDSDAASSPETPPGLAAGAGGFVPS